MSNELAVNILVFIVEDENMREVADWISENTPFDRLYFYGEDRLVHVSYGPEFKGDYIEMVMMGSGQIMPRKICLQTN